jgi:hypothetical protein
MNMNITAGKCNRIYGCMVHGKSNLTPACCSRESASLFLQNRNAAKYYLIKIDTIYT